MIKTDNDDLVMQPVRAPGITARAKREFVAELPCFCSTSSKQPCDTCFARSLVEGYH